MCKDLQENKNNKMKFHEEIDRFNSRETLPSAFYILSDE